MPQDYGFYTEISINALKFNPRSKEVIDRKQEILTSIQDHYKSDPDSVLFYGFSPLMLATNAKQISVTKISDVTKKYLDSLGVKYTYIDAIDILKHKKQFNWVVAAEEFFTFASTEEQQRINVEILAELAKEAGASGASSTMALTPAEIAAAAAKAKADADAAAAAEAASAGVKERPATRAWVRLGRSMARLATGQGVGTRGIYPTRGLHPLVSYPS
jgi:hypothetical protein